MDQGDSRWFVLHTRPRQEKAVAQFLAGKGIDHFLPLQPRTRYYGRRKMRVELPLFPGYVFLKGEPEHAYEADRADRLVQIIPVADHEKLESELANIRRAIEQEMTLDPYPFLKEGVFVEVRAGPLKGVQGVVEQRLAPDRLQLQVETLGQAVGLQIDPSLLEPVGD